MNAKNLWIAALSGAVLTTILSNIPFVCLINCLVGVLFWGSAMFSVWLYRRLEGRVTVGQGVRIGLLTGLLAGIMGFLLSFLGLAGLQGLITSITPFMSPEDLAELQGDTPAWAAILFNLIGAAVFNVGFGALGGWLGGLLFRTDKPVPQPAA